MTIDIGILIYPNMTPLDATGPAQVLSAIPGARIHYLWKEIEPVMTDAGYAIVPTARLEDVEHLDVICIPGGGGQVPLMTDGAVLGPLARLAGSARYVTSVCTGSLILGAAGLISGKRAASHWLWRDLLTQFGAIPVAERVVRDGNLITGGGVTAGIDFAFTLVSEIAGVETARFIALMLEYDPDPVWAVGSPEKASPAMVERARAMSEKILSIRLDAVRQSPGAAH